MASVDAAPRAPDPGAWASAWIADVAARLEGRPVRAVLEWALTTFAPRICVATGFGPQTIVILHQVAAIRPETTVVWLDTGLLFAETHALREQLADRLGLTFTRLAPELSLEGQAAAHGEALWARNPDRCCWLRKVAPLRRHLAEQHAWVTGIRNRHGATRAAARLVEWDVANALIKVNPLVRWSDEEVWRYLHTHRLPYNRLHREGYASVGCMPCTRSLRPGERGRDGRWAGTTKTECGIHGYRTGPDPGGDHRDGDREGAP